MKLLDIREFEWDEGNKYKSVTKHRVSNEEAEEAFFDPHGRVRRTRTGRYIHFGRTGSGKYLCQVFELKGRSTIRIISSRSQDRKEREFYKEGR